MMDPVYKFNTKKLNKQKALFRMKNNKKMFYIIVNVLLYLELITLYSL